MKVVSGTVAAVVYSENLGENNLDKWLTLSVEWIKAAVRRRIAAKA
jgi:hypothetical protein